ncbi:integrase [Saccharothrix coeruleofusca]|uniref:site-specific integrase n=1 Tax=Saccharothrix coeruleofusca TaxID=33919 RepID=UPI001AE169F0|nr:tyrosine-type recombinase/integrase [Saccharothrix coeruleofusca]MBP2341140.1 integrase [Saccharothrix coeruleofusca]
MPRRPLEIGSFGEFHRSAYLDGRWMPLHQVPKGAKPTKHKSSARYRGFDGKTGQMERTGASARKADDALRKALVEHLGLDSEVQSDNPKFHQVATQWLDRIGRQQVGTTYDRYKGRLDNHVLPALGELYIRECTPARIKRALDAMEKAGLSAASRRGIRTVISGVLQEAVDLDIITKNPVRNVSRIKGGRGKKVVAYDTAQLVDFMARLDGDKLSRRADLPDLIRFLFGTGARFGEALALRWCDLNLGDQPVRMEDEDGDAVEIPAGGVWFNGNLVAVSGRGVVRHEGKTSASRGVMLLPEFLVTLLMVRKPLTAGPSDPVFPSASGGWRQPSNVQRSVRRMRQRIGYPKFTTHVGRKSVATALDKAGHSAREVAAILRHARPSMTQDVYMAKDAANPAAAASLDRFHRAG